MFCSSYGCAPGALNEVRCGLDCRFSDEELSDIVGEHIEQADPFYLGGQVRIEVIFCEEELTEEEGHCSDHGEETGITDELTTISGREVVEKG